MESLGEYIKKNYHVSMSDLEKNFDLLYVIQTFKLSFRNNQTIQDSIVGIETF